MTKGGDKPTILIVDDVPDNVAVTDVFDALVSKRPYKKAWPFERAVALIKEESGKHFDPELVDVFMGNLDTIFDFAKLNADPD